MIRHLFLVSAAAVALMLAPATAVAYEAPGFHCTVSNPTPTVVVTFTVTCIGADANSAATLAIAGNASITKTAEVSGGVTCGHSRQGRHLYPHRDQRRRGGA